MAEKMSRPDWKKIGKFGPWCAMLNGVIALGLFSYFLFVMSLGYLYYFPSFRPGIRTSDLPKSDGTKGSCNVSDGSWVYDESYPLYDAFKCPFAERGWNCWANGREDTEYAKLRWQPKDCDFPRFNATKMLEMFRGKRVVFVGDSLGRTQWESLICLLMTGVEDKESVYEINGSNITKTIRFLGVQFSTYDLRVDFYRSVFLMQYGTPPRHAPKWVKKTIILDKLDDISNEWIDSDILIFNNGGWWTENRIIYEMGHYFQEGNQLEVGLPINTGYRKAIETWAAWAEVAINTSRTRVFFKTFEANHWNHENANPCEVTECPSAETNGRERNDVTDIMIDVVSKMRIPVTILNVTTMAAYRSDGHVGTWSDNPAEPDCSHWCLPGVPETWNQLLFAHLLSS